MTTPDPAAFFRDMLGAWEKAANELGTEVAKSEAFTRTMGGATGVTARAKEAAHEAMSRALGAANMPSREDVVELTGRVTAIDERLGRIEALLTAMAPAAIAVPLKAKPARTRKPPGAAG